MKHRKEMTDAFLKKLINPKFLHHPKENPRTKTIQANELTELYKLLANQLNLYHPNPDTKAIHTQEYWTVLERTLQAFGYTHRRVGLEGIESTPILLIAPEELTKELGRIQKHTVKTLIEERSPHQPHYEPQAGELCELPLVSTTLYAYVDEVLSDGSILITTPQGQLVVNKNDLRPLTENPEE